MYFHFAAEGGFSWDSESMYYWGRMLRLWLTERSKIYQHLSIPARQVNMQVSPVHVPESGATALFLAISLGAICGIAANFR